MPRKSNRSNARESGEQRRYRQAPMFSGSSCTRAAKSRRDIVPAPASPPPQTADRVARSARWRCPARPAGSCAPAIARSKSCRCTAAPAAADGRAARRPAECGGSGRRPAHPGSRPPMHAAAGSSASSRPAACATAATPAAATRGSTGRVSWAQRPECCPQRTWSGNVPAGRSNVPAPAPRTRVAKAARGRSYCATSAQRWR